MVMKFRAHDTFFIRKGWLSKGLRNVVANADTFVTKDKDRNPMDVLGIGSNMVKALRYWLQVVGLTTEPKSGQRIQKLTEFGKLIFEKDRYLEELGTLWLLHYKLATNLNEATSWYYFFNEFGMTEFTKEDFVASLQNYVVVNNEVAALRSLNDDFACIANTYIPRYKISPKRITPENNIDCPLGELGLIDIVGKNGNSIIYKKSIPTIDLINSWIVLAIIYDQANGKREINLNVLLSQPNNIGKIFNFDSITMLEILHRAENTGLIRIIRTAGLDYIKLEPDCCFYKCIENYYKEISL